jgi:hypothetical protein
LSTGMTGISLHMQWQSVTWQCLSKRSIGLSLRIKLHANVFLTVYKCLAEYLLPDTRQKTSTGCRKGASLLFLCLRATKKSLTSLRYICTYIKFHDVCTYLLDMRYPMYIHQMNRSAGKRVDQ